jgi:hypothetical protein
VSGSHDPRSLFAPYASGKIAAEQLRDLEAALREDSELRREKAVRYNCGRLQAKTRCRYGLGVMSW